MPNQFKIEYSLKKMIFFFHPLRNWFVAGASKRELFDHPDAPEAFSFKPLRHITAA